MTDVVLVDFSDHVVEAEVVGAEAELLAGELQLVGGDVAAAVLVEVLERREQVVLPLHFVQVQRRRDELAVVDRPALVHVRLRSPHFILRVNANTLLSLDSSHSCEFE